MEKQRGLIIGIGGLFAGGIVYALLPAGDPSMRAAFTFLACIVVSGALALGLPGLPR